MMYTQNERAMGVIVCTAIILCSLAIPLYSDAAATDTSDGCAVGTVVNSSVDSSGLGVSTGNCIPVSALGTTGPTSNNQILANATQAIPPACDADINSWRAFFTASCWGPMISGVVSGALVSVASWVLALAGFLFDWVLVRTVLQFGSFINSNVIDGINVAWTVGRDISNIIIIALFVGIAGATILGITEYGVRRLLSRVLIIAILINFSLLFTKLIVDVSNFTASQFYSAAGNVIPAETTAPSTTLASAATSIPIGVSGKFMQYAGVSSFGDTSAAVYSMAKQQNSWIALIYGIFTALLFLVAAVVLLYGTFLLVTRALVLVFLMITASLAFASYLWPKLSEGGYGWNAWWNALLKNAVFAPMLMFFLWITLKLGQAFSEQTGSLGQLIKDPTSTINTEALLGYVLVIGLLFASFKLSSSFASSVAGLNLGQQAFDLGRSRLGGYAWQQTVGRFSYNRERAATTSARTASAEAERIRRRAETTGTLTDIDKGTLKKLDAQIAKNTRRANTFGSFANKEVGGVQGFAGGIGKPPTAAREVRGAQARAGAEQPQKAPVAAPQTTANAAPNASGQMEELVKNQREINARIEAGEKERTTIVQQQTEQLKRLADNNKEAAEAQKAIASDTTDRKQIEDKHSEDMIKKQIEAATANLDPAKRSEVEQDIRRNSEEQRASELRHQGEKIEQANAKIKQITESDPMLSELQKRLKEVDEKLGVDRAQAKDLDRTIGDMQATASARGAQSATAANFRPEANPQADDVVAAFRGTNKRVVRAEIFRPQSTDVAAHTTVTIEDKPLPVQNQQQKAA